MTYCFLLNAYISGINTSPSENLVLHQTYIRTFNEGKYGRNLNLNFNKINVRSYHETLRDTFLGLKFFMILSKGMNFSTITSQKKL